MLNKYTFENKERRYIPDFFIPKYNLILEVKNDYLIDTDLTRAKKGAIPNNYIYLILGKDDIFNNFDYIWDTVIKSATIIES